MDRRRFLNASVTIVTSSIITFPLNLVIGDNGKKGNSFYNWVATTMITNNINNLFLSENQLIYINGSKVLFIKCADLEDIYNEYLVLYTSVYSYTLEYNGIIKLIEHN